SDHVLAVREREALRPTTFGKELLAGVLLVGLLVAVAVFAPRIFFTVAPRFVFPYADYPPYSATALVVDPPGAAVDYGESLRVSVETRGPEPKSVALVLRDSEGREREAFPMFDAGEGQYFQTIENVQDDMEYFVRIPRGRSKRYPLTVTKLPRIEFATVTYTYPAYTRRASETRVLSG
ncbi:MAG: hypothetical protein GY851_12190, partial [bacterium]|nr:hypothetical protein [bacterium]